MKIVNTEILIEENSAEDGTSFVKVYKAELELKEYDGNGLPILKRFYFIEHAKLGLREISHSKYSYMKALTLEHMQLTNLIDKAQ